MNKAGLILGAVIIIAALAGAAYTIAHTYHPGSVTEPVQQQSGTGNAAVGANGASSIVTYSDKGFSPSPVSISEGTTVTWVNQSSHTMWIEATGPAGGDCSSTAAKAALDECQAVSSGGTYSYTFTTLGSFPYFNHALTSDTGLVVVSAASSSGPINPNALPE